VVLLGGGYFIYKNYAPSEDTRTAYNDTYSSDDPLRAGPLSDDDATADTASLDESVAEPASTETRGSTPARRSTARAQAVPEETIGITPINATTNDGDDIVVTGARRPIWESTPSQRRLSAMYPQRALDRGREGEARLACIVQDGGVLDCERVEETPGGFGAAAVRVARTFRHSQTLADGSDATGSPVNLRVVFRIDDSQRG
jgi:hypothetical protein